MLQSFWSPWKAGAAAPNLRLKEPSRRFSASCVAYNVTAQAWVDIDCTPLPFICHQETGKCYPKMYPFNLGSDLWLWIAERLKLKCIKMDSRWDSSFICTLNIMSLKFDRSAIFCFEIDWCFHFYSYVSMLLWMVGLQTCNAFVTRKFRHQI